MPCFECCLLIVHDWYTLNHFDITCVKDIVFLMGIGVSFVTNKLAKYKKTKKFLAHLSRVRYLGLPFLFNKFFSAVCFLLIIFTIIKLTSELNRGVAV